jgi:hypothetical protein
MSYSDFTLEKLRHEYGITLRDQVFFDPVGDLIPSPWLRESLNRGMSTYIVTEKARSEFIVAPILMECREKFQHGVSVFSGTTLNVDPAKGLAGECDFILARTESRYDLQAPLMLILEAKKHDIDQGLGQCAAQMLGACRYNESEGKPLPFLYGCVTTGELWHFLKLQGNDLQAHPERFAIKEISKILWFILQCLKDVDQQVSEAA